MDILELAVAGLVGLFGGVGLERYRYARKDHEHRQDYYHRLLGAVDDYADMADELAAVGPAEDYSGGPIPEPSFLPSQDDLERLMAAVVSER